MPTTTAESGQPFEGTRAPLNSNPPLAFPDRQDVSRQWTLKGLAPETVEVSREAAKRSGMKLNAWVSRALEQAAGGEVSANDEACPLPDSDHETIQHLRNEIVRLRAQSEDMRKAMETMNTVLLKLCADRI